MVLTRLITEDIQDALPPMPFSFLCDRRREGSAEAGREGAWSAGAEPMAEYEAMVSRECVSWCGAIVGWLGLGCMRCDMRYATAAGFTTALIACGGVSQADSGQATVLACSRASGRGRFGGRCLADDRGWS